MLFLIITISSCDAQEPTSLVYNQAKLSKDSESRIDSIVNDAISKRAMPGCRILAAVNQRVILNKSYGYFTYDSVKVVNDSTLYDLASVTKVAASALVLMKLYEDHKIFLDLPLSDYFRGITENGATLRDALAHQAGFKPWLDIKRANKNLCQDLFANPDDYDVVSAQKQISEYIVSQQLDTVGRYLYSDLGFYLYTLFPKKFYNKNFDVFLYETFYGPMNLRMYFNPLSKYDKNNIAPTEKDSLWRKQVVCGKVHDEGAYLMGGVSGHAGLFSTAESLAAIFQMFLNRGCYNDVQYIFPETVDLFTSQAFPENRRGLVFDKPLIDTTLNGTPSKMASMKSFGHSGFTGTFVWADPENGLLFVFLCNSIYPNRGTMLSKLDVRTKIHDELYRAVKEKKIEFLVN